MRDGLMNDGLMRDGSTSATHDVLVVGSANLDISVPVEHLAVPGETVLGGDALWSPGGKGANQAVAAARLGRSVAFVGCVGSDPAGQQLLDALDADGVTFVGRVIDGVPTGLAMIAVAADGENSITVSPGTNARLTVDDVRAAVEAVRPSVVLAQFEVPLAALAVAGATGRLIVNPAPAVGPSAELSAVLDAASIVVPNQGELAQLLGFDTATTQDELVDQARALPTDTVVVTLGAAGALVVEGDVVMMVPSIRVDAVDTTAAGDAFCGGLADGIADGLSVADAARWAVRVAAVAVMRRGAQQSLGTRAEALAIA